MNRRYHVEYKQRSERACRIKQIRELRQIQISYNHEDAIQIRKEWKHAIIQDLAGFITVQASWTTLEKRALYFY